MPNQPNTAIAGRIDPPRRHGWINEMRILPFESIDGNERTERTCKRCGLVKITIHYPYGYADREWRHPNGKTIKLSRTPPYLPKEESL